MASLDGGEPRRLLTDGSCATFVSPHFLLFMRGASLLGQWFDPDRLQLRGEPFTVVESLGGGGWYSASSNGTLVYQPVSGDDLQLTWADRNGKRTPVGEPRPYHQGSLSPDEKRMAIQIIDPRTGTADTWVLEIPSGILSRLTEEPRGATTDRAEWSMDGRELLFSSNRNGSYALYRKYLGRGDDHPVLPSTEEYFPGEWLKDGSFLFMNREGKSFSGCQRG